jgi:uncharacterized cupin superfamily protein
MIDGEAVLVEDDGRDVLRPATAAHGRRAWRTGTSDQSVRRPCTFIAVGKPAASDCHYPDIDMHLKGATQQFVRKDGSGF